MFENAIPCCQLHRLSKMVCGLPDACENIPLLARLHLRAARLGAYGAGAAYRHGQDARRLLGRLCRACVGFLALQ